MSWLITPQQPVPVDPVFNNVSLLLHGNGTNGSTTITDNSPSPKTVTAVGNAQISTAQSKFGGASIAFDGSGDYLTVLNSSQFNFGVDDFTIEAWFYRTSTAQFEIASCGNPGADGFFFTSNTSAINFGTGSAVVLGAVNAFATGYIDEFRITKGVCPVVAVATYFKIQPNNLMKTERANEDQFNELHGLVTNELIGRIKSGVATTQDLKAATDWLTKNNITGVPVMGSPLATLFSSLELELEDVERAIR
jgi:hypothetical protein